MCVQELPKPDLAGDGLLLRVEAAAICNTTDYRSYAAEKPEDAWPSIPWPVVIGHEFVGRVVEVGDEVDDWQPGERIAGWGVSHGAYAEFTHVVPRNMAAIRVPEDLPAEEAAFLELVIGALRYLVCPGGWPIQPGHRVAVTGLGPSGLLYLQFASLFGAAEVWVADRNAPRCEIAAALGATHIFTSVEELAHTARAAGVHMDALLDSTGADLREPVSQFLSRGAFVAPFGVGFNWYGLDGTLEGIPFRTGAAGLKEARQAVKQVEQWLAEGSLKLAPMVSQVIGLHDIAQSLEALQQRPKHLVKVIVRP